MIRQIATAVILGGFLLGPACAQDTPPEGPPPGGPTGPETKAERQKNNAAKLAGLLAFVKTHCADLRPNDDRFRGVVTGLGVSYDDLQSGDLDLRTRAYAEIYAKDIAANCTRAAENFGPGGRTIPDLVAKR